MGGPMWQFYVYELMDVHGVAYVGKGSGDRLRAQRRSYGLDGHEVARFKRERDAYTFERAHIAATSPRLNRHPGGNGSRATPVRIRADKFAREYREVGPRRYVARALLRFDPVSLAKHGLSNLEAIRQVANGPWC